jgi:outer membrane protein TolC
MIRRGVVASIDAFARVLLVLTMTCALSGRVGSARAEPLSLADAVRRATGEAAPVRIAQLTVQEHEAKARSARSALLPSLTAAASQSERTYNINSFGIPFPGLGIGPRIGPVPTFDARVRASQTIADVSAWRHLASVRAGSEATRADARTSIQDAAEDAALRYSAAERALATLDARRLDLELATELDSVARVQLAAGTAANIDLLRAGTQRAAARGEWLVAQDAFERARIDLSRALGGEVGARFELTDSLGKAIASDAPEARDQALTLALARRSELQGEQARLLEARVEKSAIASERIPRLDAAADYGANGLHLDDAIATRQVAVELTWPFFDGSRREARLEEQAATIQKSEVKKRDLTERVAAEVAIAVLDLESGREQVRIADERLGLALQQLSEARTRFQSGVASNLEVIDAQSAVNRARDAEIAARAAAATASIHLARATGVAQTLR